MQLKFSTVTSIKDTHQIAKYQMSVAESLKYYYIKHDIPALVFKSVCLFNMNPASVCLLKFNN